MTEMTAEQALVDLEILESLTVMVDGHGGGDYGEHIREDHGQEIDNIRAVLSAPPRPESEHTDDVAVDRFAEVMKEKLASARAKGRSGWDDPNQCSVDFLAELLAGHTKKGNPGNFIDVANFAMMLHMRGADPQVMPAAFSGSDPDELTRLLEALEPFVALLQIHNDINEYGRPHRNDKPVFAINNATITVGDLRKARAALAKAKGES